MINDLSTKCLKYVEAALSLSHLKIDLNLLSTKMGKTDGFENSNSH